MTEQQTQTLLSALAAFEARQDAKLIQIIESQIQLKAELKNDIYLLDQKVERYYVELKGDIKELKAEVVEIKADIVKLKADIVEIKADIVELKADIVEIKADIVELKADIVEIKADIVELKADIVEIKADIKLLAAKSDKHEVRITNNEVAIYDLKKWTGYNNDAIIANA